MVQPAGSSRHPVIDGQFTEPTRTRIMWESPHCLTFPTHNCLMSQGAQGASLWPLPRPLPTKGVTPNFLCLGHCQRAQAWQPPSHRSGMTCESQCDIRMTRNDPHMALHIVHPITQVPYSSGQGGHRSSVLLEQKQAQSKFKFPK